LVIVRLQVFALPCGPSTLTVTELVQEPPVEQPVSAPLFQTNKGMLFIVLRVQAPARQPVPIWPAQGQPGASVSPAFPSHARLPLQSSMGSLVTSPPHPRVSSTWMVGSSYPTMVLLKMTPVPEPNRMGYPSTPPPS
jgi:hypothetical protein